MLQTERERRMLGRTQLLMVVVSLIPLGVLFYISAQFVFQPLLDSGRNGAVLGLVATLGFTAITVILGYVLVRRDTIRTIAAISAGEARLERLLGATVKLAALDDPSKLHGALLDVAAEITGAERAGLWLRERDELTLVAAMGMSLERGGPLPMPVGQGLVGTAAARGRSLLNVELAESDKSWDERVVTRTDSSLVVPLSIRGEVVAVLDLRNKLGASFDPIDQQVSDTLASQAVLFLDNAAFREGEHLFEEAVGSMVKELTEHHLCWSGHIDNVTAIADMLAERLNLSEERRAALKLACLVHDIGLLDFPKVDIGPPGGPVDHATKGAERLERMAFWSEAAPIVRAHHEQMDGRRPGGLRGFAIPMPARILALAEYVDTVTNPASPWGNKSLQDVVDELRNADDKRFDPTVAAAFVGEHSAATSSSVESIGEPADRKVNEADPWA